MLGMGETLPPLKLWLGCLSSFRNIVSHDLSLVPHVCVCDLLCCRTHAFNSCYSDLIAWLCEGLCGRVVGETGTVSFLQGPRSRAGGRSEWQALARAWQALRLVGPLAPASRQL